MATWGNEELKARLLERGLWSDFIRQREDLKSRPENVGVTTAKIARGILSEIAPDLVDLLRKRGAQSKDAKKKFEKAAEETEPKVESDGAEFQAAKIRTQFKDVDPAVFEGKSCSPYAAFMWAYPKLCATDVKPEEAPSMFAWQLYCDMKTSPALKADMLKGVLVAAVRKSEDATDDNKKFDGEGEYDLLAALAGGGA